MSEKETVQMVIARLDRLDGKMDTMAEAVTSLARAEERIATLFSSQQSLGDELARVRREEIKPLNERLRSVENWQWKVVGIATAASTLLGSLGQVVLRVMVP